MIQLARQGDTAACQRLLTGMLGQVQRIARRYARTYQWVAHSLDWQDLVQDAYEQMIGNLDRALAFEKPAAYLVGIARSSMSRICHRLDREQAEHLSLYAHVPGYEDDLLVDMIAESVRPISAYGKDEKNYQKLYQEIEQLPEKQRLIVERYHGIGCSAPEGMAEISRAWQCDINTAIFHYKKALGTLYFALVGTDEDACTSSLLEGKPRPAAKTEGISEKNRQRLDSAYAALLARGERVTGLSLQREVHITGNLVRAYLNERRGTPPPQKSPLQRLDEAYAALTSRGQKITRQSLLKESHTDPAAVAVYLRQMNHEVFKTREQRMEEAIARLQSQGKPISGNALAREAHVSNRAAHPYLRKRGTL